MKQFTDRRANTCIQHIDCPCPTSSLLATQKCAHSWTALPKNEPFTQVWAWYYCYRSYATVDEYLVHSISMPHKNTLLISFHCCQSHIAKVVSCRKNVPTLKKLTVWTCTKHTRFNYPHKYIVCFAIVSVARVQDKSLPAMAFWISSKVKVLASHSTTL